MIQANGSRPLGGVEIKPENNAPTGVNSSRMTSEIGTIVRNYAPLDVEKWADISESDSFHDGEIVGMMLENIPNLMHNFSITN